MATYGKRSGGSGAPTTYPAVAAGGSSTLDCIVSGGDGEYSFVLESAVSGAFSTCSLRVNGAALGTARGITTNDKDAAGTYNEDYGTAGNVFYDLSAFDATRVNVQGRITIRSGVVCAWSAISWASDGTTRVHASASGQHTPAAAASSVGFKLDGTGVFTAGGTLKLTRIGD